MVTPDQKRRDYKAWCKRVQNAPGINIQFPEHCRDMRCGARTKATGQPCKMKAIYANGRCKLHGGLSTGPKTEAGRLQASLNGRKGGRPRKPKS